jgi:hypothetical protein
VTTHHQCFVYDDFTGGLGGEDGEVTVAVGPEGVECTAVHGTFIAEAWSMTSQDLLPVNQQRPTPQPMPDARRVGSWPWEAMRAVEAQHCEEMMDLVTVDIGPHCGSIELEVDDSEGCRALMDAIGGHRGKFLKRVEAKDKAAQMRLESPSMRGVNGLAGRQARRTNSVTSMDSVERGESHSSLHAEEETEIVGEEHGEEEEKKAHHGIETHALSNLIAIPNCKSSR